MRRDALLKPLEVFGAWSRDRDTDFLVAFEGIRCPRGQSTMMLHKFDDSAAPYFSAIKLFKILPRFKKKGFYAAHSCT